MIRVGIWVWGTVTVVLALAVVGLVIMSGFYMGKDGNFQQDVPSLLAGMFQALKASGTVIGAVVGFSGLAWAHFFQVGHSAALSDKLQDREEPTEPTTADGE
jgi:hypothetical protein